MADVPVPVSLLPDIDSLEQTDYMLGVDRSQPVALQTGKFEAGQLLSLTAVAAALLGSTMQDIGSGTPGAAGATVINGWASGGAHFMSYTLAGLITANQDGFYEVSATIVTNVGANNGWLELYTRNNGGAWVQIGGAGTSDTPGCVSAVFGNQMTAGDTIELGINASTVTADITDSSFLVKRII